MKYTRDQQVAAFLTKIDVRGENECWPWKAATYNCGYGVFVWRGKNRAASRVMWEIAHGQDAPDDKDICHTCDNRLCINPRHLWLGTAADNMRDMHLKGRNPINLFTKDQVREIRALFDRMSTKEISVLYKVRYGAIWSIKSGRTYQFVQ